MVSRDMELPKSQEDVHPADVKLALAAMLVISVLNTLGVSRGRRSEACQLQKYWHPACVSRE